MSRQIAAIFLFLAFSVQCFHQAVMVLGYYAGTASFAQNCENKARPQLHCKGKCQLMKKLKEEEKKEQQNPGRSADSKNEVVSSRSFFATLHLPVPVVQQVFLFYHATSFPSGATVDIFHPPARG